MANMTIDEATEDDVIGGSEYMPASDGGAPKKIKTSQIAAYVLKCLRESGEQDFATTGTVSWKTSGGALKFSSGAKFAQAIIAYAFASAGMEDEDIAELESDETVFVVKVGDEEHVMTLAQLATYLQNQIIATIELNGLTSADTLSGADLMLVAQTSNNATTNKKVSLSTVRSFILNGIGAYLKDNSTLVSISGDTDQDPEFVFSYKGTTLRKWRLSNMLALAGDVHGPSSTTANKVPQWDSVSKTLKDGLTVSTALDANSTDAQLPTAAAVKTYADNAVSARFPNASTAGNVPTYTGADGKLGAGKAVVTAVRDSSVADNNNIPTEKAVRDAIQTERTYVDENVKINVGAHSQGDLAKFGSNGRNLEAGPSVTTEVAATAVAASDTKVPTEKAVRTAITTAMAEGVAAKSATTFVRGSTYASDDYVPTEKAVALAMDTVVMTGQHANGEVPLFDGTGAKLKGGTSLVTEVRSTSNASNAAIPTEKAVSEAIADVQDALDNKAASTHSHSVASSYAAGFMSATDKDKLDSIAAPSATDIGGALSDNDTIQVKTSGTWKSSAISRIWTYVQSKLSSVLSALKIDDLAAGDDNTDLDTNSTRHGLCPKLSGNTSQFLSGNGTWVVPPGNVAFNGTDGETAGSSGLVPAPAATDANKFLNSNGNWESIEAAAAEDVAPEVLAIVRYDTLFVPAAAMVPSASNGATASAVAFTNTKRDTLAFGTSADNAAEFDVALPDDWNNGSLKAKFYWTCNDSGATANTNVKWLIGCIGTQNGGSVSTAPTNYEDVTGGLSQVNNVQITPATDAFAPDGNSGPGNLLHFVVKRDNTNAPASPLAKDALLLGVAIQFARTSTLVPWSNS